MNQARKAILPEIGLEQFGFVNDAGTQNAILVLVTIAKRMIQVQKPLFVCFIDYSKAFDKVHHDKLFDILQELGIDRKNLRFLRNIGSNCRYSNLKRNQTIHKNQKRSTTRLCLLP